MAGSIGTGRDHVPTAAFTSTTPAQEASTLGSLAAAATQLSDEGTRLLQQVNSLPDVHVRPLNHYPGATTKPWPVVCVQCEQKGCDCNTKRNLTPIMNNLLRGQRMSCCCYTGMRLTHDDAVAIVDLHMPGWSAGELFPGSFGASWVLCCPKCGAQNITTLQAVRSYGRKPVCWWCSPQDTSTQFLQLVDENYNVTIPQAIVSAPHEPWPVTCRTCGDEFVLRYDQVIAGIPQACACNPRRGLTDEQARAVVLSRFPNTSFYEPYPGDRKLRWNMSCTICNTDAAPTMETIYTNPNTLGCACRAAGRNRHDEDRLEKDIRTKHPTVQVLTITDTGPEAVVRLVCNQGHDTRDLVRQVKRARQACRECRSSGGYDPDQPGYLYVLTGVINGRPALKFGITNFPEDRLSKHERTGLDTVQVLHKFTDGALPVEIENRCKALRRDYSVPTCKDDGASFDGYTETVFLDTPQATQFAAVVQDTVASYQPHADFDMYEAA